MPSAKFAYLADIFERFNGLNRSLQGKSVTLFHVQDKVEATIKKMEMEGQAPVAVKL